MDKHLHIISFNVPYPADYGGVIDVFYRIKALHAAGVKIHLHCFQYGREEAAALNAICNEVTYYNRSMSVFNHFSAKPFIVKSRSNSLLLKNLLKDDCPILFEGLHTCFFLGHHKLKERLKIVRAHNIEHDYYYSLAKGLKTITLASYFKFEAFKLKRFEQVLHHASHIAAISEADENYFQQTYGKTFLMRPGHPSETVTIQPGKGDYILYHGDLSTRENIDSVLFIIREIAPQLQFNILLAGKNPSAEVKSEAGSCENVKLICNPSHNEMQELIANAHINLLPTFQATGFKLKLLNALFNGRFCIVTPQMVEGTGLDELCIMVENDRQMTDEINKCLSLAFTREMIGFRSEKLNSNFSNQSAVSKLVKLI